MHVSNLANLIIEKVVIYGFIDFKNIIIVRLHSLFA